MHKERESRFLLLYSIGGFRYCDLLLSQGKYGEVQNRVGHTMIRAKSEGNLLDIAHNYLSLGRAHLLEAQQKAKADFSQAANQLDHAVEGLRLAGQQVELPRGLLLLARAALHRVHGRPTRSQTDLDEAMSIAQRGVMRLFEADAHLEYARLHLAMGDAEKARESLATAKAMIEEMDYHRRDPEVEELESRLAKR